MSDELDELRATVGLRHRADMRAIAQWQKAHPGKELTWPDHADLCVWLLDELTRFEQALAARDACMAELEKDAARYRWLRAWRDTESDPLFEVRALGRSWYYPGDIILDAAIDEAMSTKEGDSNG